MAQPAQRFRTDLVDVAWEMEDDYGVPPINDRLGSTANETKGRMCRQWGLVTGGVTLPNPRYEWNPYFGIGVDSRNMTMAIRGRQTLEGSVPTIMLCHDTSRYALEMCIGLMFNYGNRLAGNADGVADTSVASLLNTITATSWTVATANYSAYVVAGVAGYIPTNIIIVGNGTSPVNVWKDTWAYIGLAISTNTGFTVYQDSGLNNPGWNGKIPRTIAALKYRICSVERTVPTTSSAPIAAVANKFVDHSSVDDNVVALRTTLTQPSFAIAANFNADDGSRFTTNYLGNKISRTTLTFAEGEPVTFSWDFTGQDMSHNIGQDEGTSTLNQKILKYLPKYTETDYDTGTGVVPGEHTVEAGYMRTIRVNEQPYFFSGAQIKFKGTEFARFRNFAISIDNAIDPRWYITQNAAGTPNASRQVIKEILEGRRTISFTGSLDVDATGDAAPKDAVFLQWLLNQGVHSTTDVRDMPVVQGVEIEIVLQRTSDASDARPFDQMHIRLPAPADGALASPSGNMGAAGAVGLVLRSASMNIAGPPQVHQAMDLDGFASSIAMWFDDNTG